MAKRVRLGQSVFILDSFETGITKATIEAIGKDYFVHSYCFNEFYTDEFRRPCYYDEENTRWFRKFKDALAYLRSKNPDCILCQCDEDYWEIVID